MRWIFYAFCLSVVGIQLSYTMPTSQDSSSIVKENLQSINSELQYPTAESSGRQKRTIGVFRRIFPELSKAQEGERERVARALSESASEVKEVQVPFQKSENDLQAAASGEDSQSAESSQEEFSDDIDISESEENSRSKRLGVFGNLFGGASAGASAGGGSGNFLFDIIRRTADGAARAAGTVYRLVAGTDDLGLQGYSNELPLPAMALAMAQTPETATVPSMAIAMAQTQVTATVPPPPTPASSRPANMTLVAGSGQTESQDENANVPLIPTDQSQSQPVDDGYQTGVPGPITRLFVIANRGIANLVQDLILRLAQTSERIVNFKARLITAII